MNCTFNCPRILFQVFHLCQQLIHWVRIQVACHFGIWLLQHAPIESKQEKLDSQRSISSCSVSWSKTRRQKSFLRCNKKICKCTRHTKCGHSVQMFNMFDCDINSWAARSTCWYNIAINYTYTHKLNLPKALANFKFAFTT